MTDNIYEDLEMIMADRISEAYKKSERYQHAISIENELFEKLQKSLSVQQQELLQQYFESVSATTAICEIISYTQGIRDFVKILFQDQTN